MSSWIHLFKANWSGFSQISNPWHIILHGFFILQSEKLLIIWNAIKYMERTKRNSYIEIF
jgi:hypothetical protein